MKSPELILRSLLVLIGLSLCQFAYAQEEDFNVQGMDRKIESSSNTRGEDTYYREYPSRERKIPKETPERKEQQNVQHPAKETTSNSTKHAGEKSGIKTPQPKPIENKKEEPDESVLSFNFLYYMIQKFKFSDVIDQ